MANFHRFTIKAQESLQRAQELVMMFHHSELKALHILHAVVEDEQALTRQMLESAGIDFDVFLQKINCPVRRTTLSFT